MGSLLCLNCSDNSKIVSDIFSIQNYIDNEIDSSLQTNSNLIFQHLTHYRKIKGDGNCFYRSISFLLLESLLLEKDIPVLASIIHEIKNDSIPLLLCHSPPSLTLSSFLMDSERLKNAISNPLCSLLQLLQQEEKWEEHRDGNSSTLKTNMNGKVKERSDYYQLVNEKGGIARRLWEIFNEDFFFDLGMVIYVRSKIYSFLQEKEKMKFYEPFIDDIEQLKKILIIFDKEAESSIIAITAEVFNINLEVYILYIMGKRRERSLGVFVERHEPKFEKNHKRRILKLFFRPGHYDVGYNF